MLLEYGSDPTAELEDGTKPGQKFDATVPAETQKVKSNETSCFCSSVRSHAQL
jgi:hypothetical protein